jgi:AcrR family transcriptional regulator
VATTASPERPQPQRRSARRAAHSRAILEAAHRLVAEKGEDFTTQELIKEAGVALQTFYRHYGSKDQLLLAVIGDLIAEHCRGLAETHAHAGEELRRHHRLGEVVVDPGLEGGEAHVDAHLDRSEEHRGRKRCQCR